MPKGEVGEHRDEVQLRHDRQQEPEGDAAAGVWPACQREQDEQGDRAHVADDEVVHDRREGHHGEKHQPAIDAVPWAGVPHARPRRAPPA